MPFWFEEGPGWHAQVYARTHTAEAVHASFAPIKALAATWWDLDPHIALFGENMTAVHSIKYDGLRSNFYLFGVFDCQRQVCMPFCPLIARDFCLCNDKI